MLDYNLPIIQIAFGGDQLTAEQAHSAQIIRVTSDDSSTALQGFLPFSSDWHAEVALLEVRKMHCYSKNLTPQNSLNN